jgi:hypothetical protein
MAGSVRLELVLLLSSTVTFSLSQQLQARETLSRSRIRAVECAPSLLRVTTPSTTLQRPLEDEREVDHMKLEMKPPNTGELWEQATQKVLALGARASSALSHRLPDRAAPRHDLARPALTLVRAKCMREWISPRGNCIMNMSEDAGARLRGAASRKTRGYRRCAGMASCTRMAEPEQPTDTPSPNCLLLAQHVSG